MTTTMSDLRLTGNLTVPNTGVSAQTRGSILQQDSGAIFPIDLTALRVWDAYHTVLPGTAASDDLALTGGTFGTASPTVDAGDLKAAGATTRYARFQVSLPECYVAGQTVTLSISAGMATTIADTSCTLDVEAYESDKEGGIGSDLCTTAATTINSLTFADVAFTITPGGLTAGDVLDIRIAIACNDGATGTAVTPTIGGIDLLCDIKG